MKLFLIILLGLLVNCNSLIVLKNTTFELCQQVDENTIFTNSANDTINTYLFISLFQYTIGCNEVKKCELYFGDYYNHRANVCYKIQNFHLDRNVEVDYNINFYEHQEMIYFAIFLLIFIIIIIFCYSQNNSYSKCCHCECSCNCKRLVSCCHYMKDGCKKCYSKCYEVYYRIKRKKETKLINDTEIQLQYFK